MQRFTPRFQDVVRLVVIVSLAGLSRRVDVSAADPPGLAELPATAMDQQALAQSAVSVLRVRCFGCHGEGQSLEGNLDLRSRSGILQGGDSGPAVVPGQPENSSIFQAVLRTGELSMPPKEQNKLAAAEIETLRRWIEQGAVWPEEKPKEEPWHTPKSGGITIATSGGTSRDWTNRRYDPGDIWAFQPIQRYPVPWESLEASRRQHPIDAFLQRRLQAAGLKSAQPADPRIFIRRATLGLTGLPPTPEEVADFLQDEAPRAYGRLIDRLLDSPHYGEQMARHWLDVVRYADTSGFANDYERPNAWRYRDYVIRSFNADRPYDRFVVEQLAGDELDPDDPEMLIAVGFLRMGPWEHTGMSVAAVTRQQYLDDVTNSVGVTFLGQALRCARCHDHKFDPVPTRDYYRIQAVFTPVQFADRVAPYQPDENTSGFDEARERTERLLQETKDFLASIRKKNRDAIAAFMKERGIDSLDDLPAEERPKRHFGLTALEMSLEKIYNKRRDYYERELKRYEPYAYSVYSGPFREIRSNKAVHLMPKNLKGRVADVFILAGGALDRPGDKVTPGVLSAVAGSNDAISPTAWNTIPESTVGRRLAFAQWLASPNNTLTARVIVNRVWQIHFGTGLVATPNNFGKMGQRPTHPELLDWLATWFMDHGWSIKRLNRLIMTSAAYQQSTRHADLAQIREIDPNNRLLARFPTRRLAAEEIRDSMLAITGELNPEMGGPGIYPEINWEVARQPRHIMGSVAPAYQPSARPEQRHRRTIYAFRYRTLADPLLEVFNQPSSDVSCERRDETTVTPQVFALFNGQFVHDRALALAARLQRESETLDGQIERGFQLVFGRVPTENEMSSCRNHVLEMREYHQGHPPVEVPIPTSVTRQMVEELTGETFEWTEELDVMKDYIPDLKPWDTSAETRALAELCLVLLNSNEFMYIR